MPKNVSAKRKQSPAVSSRKSDLIRIDLDVKEYLEQEAARQNTSMAKVLREWAQEHKLRQYAQAYEHGYEQLQGDEKGWHQELAERALWDGTLVDASDQA
jgi:hypothetical protein